MTTPACTIETHWGEQGLSRFTRGRLKFNVDTTLITGGRKPLYLLRSKFFLACEKRKLLASLHMRFFTSHSGCLVEGRRGAAEGAVQRIAEKRVKSRQQNRGNVAFETIDTIKLSYDQITTALGLGSRQVLTDRIRKATTAGLIEIASPGAARSVRPPYRVLADAGARRGTAQRLWRVSEGLSVLTLVLYSGQRRSPSQE